MGKIRDKMDQLVISANTEVSGLNTKTKAAMTAISCVLALSPVLISAMAADVTIFDKVATIMDKIYLAIVGISSVTAGCMATICLFMMFFSKNGRTVEESVAWLKRIVICWIAIMAMSSIIKFLTSGLDLSKPSSLKNAGDF